ncbi:tannase/feruloyl esterase family alpha/beta hydrolase [Aurantiacibacter flavus]|uniref:Tannase/feruloyl esterase family alpha/beta hydrolase n=1 Tax=Aurantiacibacter flavus TaxID=3145232 RepID=A0ABV0CVY1_9SPHN
MNRIKELAASISLATLALTACSPAEPEAEASALIATSADACSAFDVSTLGTGEGTATWVDAAEGLPAHCEITATLSPVEGSAIGVVYRLPSEWNGKLLGIGGGGWAGNVTIEAAADGLAKNFATMQTNGGNAGTNVWANDWVAEKPVAAEDFSHRAVHEMTVAGKQVAASLYGTAHESAYFNGCSTGGRMALMEAQRYPEDYDAIIAGAPVYTLQVQTSAVFRNQTFAQDDGAAGFTPVELQLVQDAALAACDGNDGLEDGLINDPRACTFDPAKLQCTGEKDESCLSGPQVNALKQVYSGQRASDESWSMFPMSRGGEAGWSLFMATDGSGEDPTGGGGLGNLFPLFFERGESPTLASLDNSDYLAVRASPFAEIYEAKSPDLSAFFERGGKLMLWHGESDPGPSPVGSTDYALQVLGANPQANDQFRYFLLPGVGHCQGGPGADLVDYLGAMDEWASGGTAPERLIGTKDDGSLTRPHCAWPNVAHYKGEGDTNNPASWTCEPRKS